MNCRKAEKLLSRYLDDRLDAADRARFESHLETCAVCGESHRLLIEARSVFSSLGPAEPPADLAERAARAAMRADRKPVTGDFFDLLRWPALAGAAAASVFACILMISTPDMSQSQTQLGGSDAVASLSSLDDVGDDDDEELLAVLGGE